MRTLLFVQQYMCADMDGAMFSTGTIQVATMSRIPPWYLYQHKQVQWAYNSSTWHRNTYYHLCYTSPVHYVNTCIPFVTYVSRNFVLVTGNNADKLSRLPATGGAKRKPSILNTLNYILCSRHTHLSEMQLSHHCAYHTLHRDYLDHRLFLP